MACRSGGPTGRDRETRHQSGPGGRGFYAGALRVDIGALVMLLQAVDGDPVAAVVPRRVGDETDAVGGGLAFVAPLLQKEIEALAHKRTRAVAGILRDHPQ